LNAFLSRSRVLFFGVLLGGIVLAGCSSDKPSATATVAPQGTPIQAQTIEQRTQNRARVLQTIQPMNPEQRAAYFKAHPDDMRALAQ